MSTRTAAGRTQCESNHDSSATTTAEDSLRAAICALRSKPADSTIHQKAAAQLYALAGESVAAAAEALDAGAAYALCQVLREGNDDAKRNAAAALYNLAPTAELAARTVDVSMLDALVEVLTDGPEDASQNAAAALYRFAHTAELASSILDAGAAPALVRILHRGSDSLRQHAAAALYALACDGPLAQRVIGTGAPCALFEVMQTSATAATCEAACEALCALVRTPEHAAHVVDTGVVPGLIRMLVSTCTRSQRLAACTISVLAAADEGGAIVSAGAVPLVVRVLLSGDPGAQEYAASALSNLASSFGPRSNFVEAGALPALVAAMRSARIATRRSAVVALHHLTLDTPIGVFAAGAGALPPLIAALTCGDRSTEEAAAGVAYNLACESLVLGNQIIDAGMLEPLVQMLAADQHSDAALDLAAGAILSLAGEPTLRARVLAHSTSLFIVRIGARRPRGRALTLMDTLMADSHARRQLLSAFGREYEAANSELRTLRDRNAQLEETHRRLANAVTVDGEAEGADDDASGVAASVNDVTLSFRDGRTLGASKLLLATNSHYFRAQLCGPISTVGAASATNVGARARLAPAHGTKSTVPPPAIALHDSSICVGDDGGASPVCVTGGADGDESSTELDGTAEAVEADAEAEPSPAALAQPEASGSPPLQQRCLREAGARVVHPDETFSFEAYHALLRQLHSSGFEALPESPALVVELHALARKMSPTPGVPLAPCSPSGSKSNGTCQGGLGTCQTHAPPTDLPDTLARVATACEQRMIDGLDVDNCLDLLLHARACDGAHRLVRSAGEFVRGHLRAVTVLPRWQTFCAQNPTLALEIMTGAAVALDEKLREGTKTSTACRKRKLSDPCKVHKSC